jgi:hypothetical protein
MWRGVGWPFVAASRSSDRLILHRYKREAGLWTGSQARLPAPRHRPATNACACSSSGPGSGSPVNSPSEKTSSPCRNGEWSFSRTNTIRSGPSPSFMKEKRTASASASVGNLGHRPRAYPVLQISLCSCSSGSSAVNPGATQTPAQASPNGSRGAGSHGPSPILIRGSK